MGTSIQDPSLGGLPAGVDQTEAGYLDGVTSALQTQLNAKAALSGTPAANQVPVFAGASALAGSKEWLMAFQTGTLSAGLKITTAIPASGAADGLYEVDLVYEKNTGSQLLYAYKLSFRVVSGALSGTPLAPGFSAGGNPINVAVSVEGGFFCITAAITASTYDVYLRVRTYAGQASYFTGWAVSDAAAVSGTNATVTFRVSALTMNGALSGVTSLAMGGALSGVTTIDHSGAQTMSGSPASAGASVRNIHGVGGTTDLGFNVPTSGNHRFYVNGTQVLGVASSGLFLTGSTFIMASGYGFGTNTADGSDTFRNWFGGGGSGADTRGALLEAHGNEHSTAAGKMYLSAGNVSGAAVEIYTAGTRRLGINHDGTANVDATFGASLAAAIGAGAVTGSIAMWGTGSAPTGYLLCDGSAVSRSTYAALFALLSTTFGAGNGSTTFNLPDFRGRAPIGAGTGGGLTARTLAGTTGVESVTLTAAQSGLPAHTHTVPGGDTPNYGSTAGKLSGTGTGGAVDTSSTGGSAASSSHDNMQPSLVVNFIIKT